MEHSPARRGLVSAGVGLVILLVGLFLGRHFFPRPPQPSGEEPLQAVSQPKPEAHEGGAPPDAESRISEPRSEAGPGDLAREYVAELKQTGEPPDLEVGFARAEAFRAQGHLADTHLLLFFLARQGHGASARELAGFYDPLLHSPDGSIMDEPDPAQAFKWYQKAAQAGDTLAAERLDALRRWVEYAAREGDPEARRILMQWR